MDYISLLLHILFGGLTAGIAASFPPGKPLGVWGYLIGTVPGLIGGVLFLNMFRPGDVIGSVIAAMFTALLFIFVLRLTESLGFDFVNMPTSFLIRSSNMPKLADPASGSTPNAASFFNIFDDDDEASISEMDTSPSSALHIDTLQPGPLAHELSQSIESDAPHTNSVATSAATLRGYDEDMFGQGINSLQGPSFFDTDDEIPNIETSTHQDEHSNSDKARLERALDLLTSDQGDLAQDDALSVLPAFDDSALNMSNLGVTNVVEQEYSGASGLIQSSGVEDLPSTLDAQVLSRSQNALGPSDGDDAERVDTMQFEFDETPALSEDEVVGEQETLFETSVGATVADLPLRDVHDYPDDLTKIKGIGKVYAQRLKDMGIYTWIQVAETEPPLLKDWVAATKTANVDEWPQLARSLAIANDRTEAHYSGPPPDDLTEIIGITKRYEQMLNKLGIVTFSQLVQAEPKAVIEGLAPARIVDAAIYDWQVQAELKSE